MSHRVRSRSPRNKGVPQGVAVVTGASRGIGAAIARSLAREGYTVAVNFKASREAAAVVVSEIQELGGTASAFQSDVAKEDDVIRLFDEVAKAWPELPLKVLVNNAGIIGPRGAAGKLEETSVDSLREVFDTNVQGPLICCREFAKRAARGSSITNISSGSAYIGNPGLYAMSKGALNSMQIWLVRELAPKGIRVNAISPGMTRTDMIADVAEGFDMSQIPLGRFGEPEEIADAVVFLCSEKASYIAGANLRVAGGRPPGTTLG